MAKLLVLYKMPKDPAAFDRYYRSTHIPLAKKLPGLRKYEISNGAISTPTGAADIHLVATLHFDSIADIQRAFSSPEGQATAGDLANFAGGGVDLYFFDTEEV
ncbi:EthD family reductase [Ensifer sp. IC4062]|nr:EthD family reductase [Ensifer sp. IC4062]MCA1439995.1 EthD family reductase [Ensifer sp. IC4062]